MSENIKGFEDLVLNHTAAYMSGPKEWINDAQKSQTYWVGMEAAGGRMSDMIQAGTHIEDRVILSIANRARSYDPENSVVGYNRSDITKKVTVPWRFVFTYVAFDDHELLLGGGAPTAAKGRALQIKDLIETRYLEQYTDLSETMEAFAWAQPTLASMGPQGQDQYSLPYFVNEFTNGLFPGFTDVMGIDPAVEPNWRPYQGKYAQAPQANWDAYHSIFRAMRKTSFKKLPFGAKHSGPQTKSQDLVIAASDLGITAMEKAALINQDLRRREGGSSDDPFSGDITVRGIPVHYYAGLDGAEIHATGTAGAPGAEEETAAGVAGPRFIGLNATMMRTVHHSKMYMRKMPVTRSTDQPWSFVVPMHSACNRICRSRRRQWIVSPSTNIAA